ncbi:transposase domain-containing protein [Rhizophagus clarus]|uniref:Transposase domain-containing protein n=1 Tax=Rhizophagus clarus TaxID=94130 RepID=A0A8H3LDB6_9GLOM|nr:transposase domain-containing protein [Rhizophagus clarus]
MELQELEEGVPYIDGHTNEQFILRVHLLTWIGDIPALSKSLNLTGHNSYKACRFCMIKKICHPLNYHIYYPSSDIVYNIRNHDDTVNMAKLIDNETIKIQKNNMIKETGSPTNVYALDWEYLEKRHLLGWSNIVKAVKLYLEPVISEDQVDDSIFKEKLPKQWNSKQVFGDIEEYEEELYWPSIHYSLSGQEYKYLIKFYERPNSENDINNYGMKYGRLRTSDGQYV